MSRFAGLGLALLALGFAGCTQTQVADTAKGAGGVLAETLVTTVLDIAFGTHDSTRNLTEEERAQCEPRGDCLARSHRKAQETDAFIARNRNFYDQQFGEPESALTNSLADWMNREQPAEGPAEDATSIMLGQPPLQAPSTRIDGLE